MNTRAQPLRRGPSPLVLKAPVKPGRSVPLGQLLVEMGELSAGDMLRAVAMRAREDGKIGTILLANGMVTEAGLYRGLAAQYDCELADLRASPPDARLVDRLGPERCIELGLVPWRRIGRTTIFATSRPEDFATLNADLSAEFGQCLLAVAPETEINKAVLRIRLNHLSERAETRQPPTQSCRSWNGQTAARYAVAGLFALMAAVLVSFQTTFLFLCAVALCTLVINTSFKALAAWATWRQNSKPPLVFSTRRNGRGPMVLPTISILVPLFREHEIAGRLLHRLTRLNYPKELMDVILVVEEDDVLTRSAVEKTTLPAWMRAVVVPRGTVKTKPRALNYALDFCHGSIVGVYDAEDAPHPDQLYKVARRFHDRGDRVACLQGVLDFYNAQTNWLSRCFTIEYATWFRVVLPGLEKLGLVVPLGGTTLFIRRQALECLGGWDAHNVTEDADLGMRLARQGLRTELFSGLTEEEANCRLVPWIKQRSRWIKGYGMTWAVHMKSPRNLLRDIGLKRFVGVQVLFLGTLLHFLLAPILWSFWLLPLGFHHPISNVLPSPWVRAIGALFLSAEFLSLAIGYFAMSHHRHRSLRLWLPTLNLYFALATIASYKAFLEMITKPFYWDKTQHGQDALTK